MALNKLHSPNQNQDSSSSGKEEKIKSRFIRGKAAILHSQSSSLLLSFRQTKSHKKFRFLASPLRRSHASRHPHPPWQPTSPSPRRLSNHLPRPANSSSLLHRRHLFFVVLAVVLFLLNSLARNRIEPSPSKVLDSGATGRL